PVIKKWTVVEKNEKGEDVEVTYMTIDGVMVHETDPALQPPPPVVTPGSPGTPEQLGPPPSDAVVLFDGSDLANWVSMDNGKPTQWIVQEGAMQPTPDSGMIQSRQEFGSCQLDVEWATPKEVSGEGQGRGNSGVFLLGQY